MKGPVTVSQIEVLAGVSAFNHQGFCIIEVTLSDGRKHIAQMTPDEVREMILPWLGAASAAEEDAALYAELREGGIEENVCLGMIQAVRNRREKKKNG